MSSGATTRTSLTRLSRGDRPPSPRPANIDAPTRILDDSAVAEIAKIPGVVYVEPAVFFGVQVRFNGRTFGDDVAGCNVPNLSSRFREFEAGQMISSPQADEAVVTFDCARNAGFATAADAIGKNIEFLVPAKGSKPEDEEPPSFFGLPLGGDEAEPQKTGVTVGRT